MRVNEAAVAEHTQALDRNAALNREVMATAEVYRMVGRFEAAQFQEAISGRMLIETYQAIKALLEEKGSVHFMNPAGELEETSSLDAFCAAVFPVSGRRIRQIEAEIRDKVAVVGSDRLYEQAERIGFKPRDYRALRVLPNDMQAVVKQALESGDGSEALQIVRDLAKRHEALQTQLAEATNKANAKEEMLEERDRTIRKFQEAEARRLSADPGEREKQQVEDLAQAALDAELAVRRLIKVAGDVDGEPASEAAKLKATQAVDYVFTVVQQQLAQTGIFLSLETLVQPSWMAAIPQPGESTDRA